MIDPLVKFWSQPECADSKGALHIPYESLLGAALDAFEPGLHIGRDQPAAQVRAALTPALSRRERE